ncbi:MAG: hypothetical protein EXS36_17760 [Pedosphaera sp.]|nr:hypothetical protein [Pedosphaera sp.]
MNRGGGLLLFAGDEVIASRFNSDFADLCPVALRAVESADGDSDWRIGKQGLGSALFAPFREPNSGNLALPAFKRRFSVAPGTKGIVSARFEDDVPLLVGSITGSSRVLWANTSADTTWNDWPKHKTFVPWLHQTVLFLAGRDRADRLRAGANFVAGAESELELGTTAQNVTFRLRGLTQNEVPLTTDDQGRLTMNLSQPGLYSLRDAGGRELHRLAVNVPASESDLVAWRPAEFQQQITRRSDGEKSTLTAGLFGPSRNQREFWRVLLVVALVLLYLETLYSNRSHA